MSIVVPALCVGGKLVTLFSAPDYPQFMAEGEDRYHNKAAVLHLTAPDYATPQVESFEAVLPRPQVATARLTAQPLSMTYHVHILVGGPLPASIFCWPGPIGKCLSAPVTDRPRGVYNGPRPTPATEPEPSPAP